MSKRDCSSEKTHEHLQNQPSISLTKQEKKIEQYEQARANYKARQADPLYMRGTQRCLRDALEVLCAYEQMMFETLSKTVSGIPR